MKLYTEDQVRKAIRMTRNEYPLRYSQDIINDLTHITLPTDEDIEKEIQSDVHINSDTDFFNGAKWVIEQIKKQI